MKVRKKLFLFITILTLAMGLTVLSYGADWLTPYQISVDGVNPTTLEPSLSSMTDNGVCLSPDGKMLFISSNRPGSLGSFDYWVSTTEASGLWSDPVNMGSLINDAGQNGQGCSATADGLQFYFSTNNAGWFQLRFATRTTLDQSWTSAAVSTLRSPIDYRYSTGSVTNFGAECPNISPDGMTLYYDLLNCPYAPTTSYPGYYGTTTFGNYTAFAQIFSSQKVGGVWQIPDLLYSLNSGYGAPDTAGSSRFRFPWVSASGKYIYAIANSNSASPFQEPYMSVRTDVNDPWPTPTLLTELDAAGNDYSISVDEEMDRVVFISDRPIYGVTTARRVWTAVGILQIRQDGLPIDSANVTIGQSTTVRARGGLKNYSWSLSTTGIVSISSGTGREITLTGLSKGTVNLTLTDPGSVAAPSAPSQQTTIQVIVSPVAMVISPSNPYPITVGQNQGFSVTGGVAPYTWSFSSTGIASLDTTAGSSVVVTGVSPGTVDLIVTDSDTPTPQQTSIEIDIVPTSSPLFPDKESWEFLYN